ncbi:hypothetical protein ACFQ1M_08930 [Sungkyunkwania multivorans]|uniref:Uncharacterized protein n=1 Tax=Sungkyunkwania multivorans TaxID=1173618 RepID=A0ABW3CX39_9FLAO
MKRKCKICSNQLKGRRGQLFCSLRCKNYYHVNLRKTTSIASEKIDRILHRNRSILLELMGKHITQKKIPRILLEQKKFRFKYLTHFHINSKGKTYHWVYDFAWVSFSDDEVMIVRKKTPPT